MVFVTFAELSAEGTEIKAGPKDFQLVAIMSFVQREKRQCCLLCPYVTLMNTPPHPKSELFKTHLQEFLLHMLMWWQYVKVTFYDILHLSVPSAFIMCCLSCQELQAFHFWNGIAIATIKV